MKRYITTIAALVLCAVSFGQGIDTSVQVTNDYRSDIPEVSKAGLKMNVPDTLRRFDYNFDYSVFESPYKGAYEFSPYRIDVQPDASVYDGKRFYLRAGAGYTFRPELDFVYSPIARKDFALNVFADAGGYLLSQPVTNNDIADRLGVDMRWTRKKNIINLSVMHDGVFAGDPSYDSKYNAGVASFRIRSTDTGGATAFYDVSARYRFGIDAIASHGNELSNEVSVTATAGPVFKDKYRLLVDLDFRHESISGLFKCGSTYVGVLPHASFVLGPVNLDAGLRIDYAEGLKLSPEAKASVDLGVYAKFYAGVSGCQKMNAYSDFKAANHHYQVFWNFVSQEDHTYYNVTREAINLYGGFSGHIGTHFLFNLKGGFAKYDNVPLVSTVRTCYAYTGISMPYASVDLSWKSERLDISARTDFRVVNVTAGTQAYAPAPFDIDLKAVYNLNKRFYVGALLQSAGAMKAYGVQGADVTDVPAWVDAGMFAEYWISSRFGAWVKAGNILCQEIRRNPLYAEKGPYVTGGICCTF